MINISKAEEIVWIPALLTFDDSSNFLFVYPNERKVRLIGD